MGVVLIFAIIFVLGVISYLLYRYTSWADEGWLTGGILAMVSGGFVFVLLGMICLINNNSIATDKCYQDLVYTKQVIEYRLENLEDEENITVNGGVYNDVIEYNNTIREYKMYTYNFWIGWFYADKPATLDYIELPESVS